MFSFFEDRCRTWPVTPYFGVRTNSHGFFLIEPQIAEKTARALLMLTPTPRAISMGMYINDFQPACLPNSSRCPIAKNMLAEQVARMNRLKLKMYWLHVW